MKFHDSMRDYMRDINRIPLVTREEEVELGRRIQQGDEEAKEKLIKANLRLVVKIAHDFKGMGLPLQDLVAEGNIGLMRATEKFDPEKGAKFSSYAAWWIKQAMRRALSEKSKTIRIPVASVTKMIKIRQAHQALRDKLQREPTRSEIAKATELSERVVRRLQLSDMRTMSLQDPILEGEEGQVCETVPDEETSAPDHVLESREAIEQIRFLIKHLDPREQKILSLRFGLEGESPHTLEEISHHIERTRERVRQIQKRALQKLRLELLREELKAESSFSTAKS